MLIITQTALELGFLYAPVALALFLSYSILNIADLSTDGCFTLGCAVACQVALTGHPILALFAAMAAGVCSGFVTAFLQTRLGVESIMAGIIVNTGLYTINLAVMGFSSTMSLVKTDTVFSLAKSALDGRLAKRIGKIQTALQTLNAHLTAWVDYPEEDVPELSDAAFVGTLTEQKAALDALISGYSAGAVLRHGVDCVLLGRANVGKSTLMNLLSKSDVFAENKLFATLDTTVRKVIIDNLPFLLSDTVGFIRKLPTDLVDSFKSTLDEVREADLLLHVVDIAHPDFEDQIQVVEKTLGDLGCSDKPCMIVFNKIDAYDWVEKEEDDLTPATKENVSLDDLMKTWMARRNDNCIFISAREKTNLEELKKVLYDKVRELHVQKYPYNDFLFEKYDEEGA